ncbi:MAG: M14 metallopeptidase family protein, partial [Thermoanaerobaculia bacterium]
MTRRIASFILVFFAAISLSAAAIPSPSQFLGFEVGADRTLADYHQIDAYFHALEKASPRVAVESLGKSTLGNDMLMVVVSSEANMKNLSRIKEISRRLADPRGLSAGELDSLVKEGKAVVLVTCNIHSTEIASSQMAMEWAWSLATATDAQTMARLDDVVLLLVPSLNPDGQIMETEWYRKWLGTKYEGGRMPWLYHPYVGHDDNRDWFMLTQKETRNMSRAIYHEWFPQVFVDEHQMGSEGPRMFIPPFSDPMDPDVNPLIWREVNLIGANMALRLEQAGKAGLIYGYSFDAYWMGGTRNTGWWKNITGLLLEIASAKMATPVYVEPTELRGGSKGLSDYRPQVNFPNPWRGGWWHLRDIMDYERIASDALLEIASRRREDLLRDIAARANAAIATAGEGGWRIPADQRDRPTAVHLARILADHNVEVYVAENGDFWIPASQPYSRFVEELLEPQRYPEVRMTGATDILPPYDVATWTLPLMMGVEAKKVQQLPAPVAKLVASGARRLPPSADMRVAGRDYTDVAIASEAPVAPFYALDPVSPERFRVSNVALHAKNADVRIATHAMSSGAG